jgi:hypothetical protein
MDLRNPLLCQQFAVECQGLQGVMSQKARPDAAFGRLAQENVPQRRVMFNLCDQSAGKPGFAKLPTHG